MTEDEKRAEYEGMLSPEEEASMAEALAEYSQHKREQEQEECPHDELDHGICLSCSKDCWDDVVDATEFASDCREDR